jgi:general stress protein 26
MHFRCASTVRPIFIPDSIGVRDVLFLLKKAGIVMNKVLEKVSRIARILANNNHVLLLSTIGLSGGPRSRYIGGFSIKDTADLYLISPADTDKIREIQKDSRVQIIFSSKDYRKVLTLNGNAKIVEDESLRRAIYEEKESWGLYPVFNDYFGVIHFVPNQAEYLDLDISNDVVMFQMPRD